MIRFLFKLIIIATAGSLLPVFADDVDKESTEFLKTLEEQLIFRKKVEDQSFATTTELCDAFVLRQKYNMGLYPDPATETYKTFVQMGSDERFRYYSSLYAWLSVGHQGMLVNWGLEDNPIDTSQNLLLINHSRFLKTLIVTKGFFEASKNCGELNATSLKKLLYEQELAQASMSFVIAPLAVVRAVSLAGRAGWPLIRSTAFGSSLAKVPWGKVGAVAFTAAISFVLYAAYEDYQTLEAQKRRPKDEKQNMDKLIEGNVKDALIRWSKNSIQKNEVFKDAEAYLLDKKTYLLELQKQYESELSAVGEQKINQLTEKFVKSRTIANPKETDLLTDDELEIFMKAVTFANLKAFIHLYKL